MQGEVYSSRSNSLCDGNGLARAETTRVLAHPC